MRFESRKFKIKLWWIFQGIALFAMVSTPLWLRRDFESLPSAIPKNAQNVSAESAAKPLSKSSVDSSDSSSLDASTRRSVITSEVLDLDFADAFTNTPNTKPRVYQANARQLRFTARVLKVEIQKNSQLNEQSRLPANAGRRSKGKIDEWTLVHIEKVTSSKENVEDSIELLGPSDEEEVASVYVELEVGKNDFLVTYANKKGLKKTLPISVNFQGPSSGV